jgi:hypothetical protein
VISKLAKRIVSRNMAKPRAGDYRALALARAALALPDEDPLAELAQAAREALELTGCGAARPGRPHRRVGPLRHACRPRRRITPKEEALGWGGGGARRRLHHVPPRSCAVTASMNWRARAIFTGATYSWPKRASSSEDGAGTRAGLAAADVELVEYRDTLLTTCGFARLAVNAPCSRARSLIRRFLTPRRSRFSG